MFKFMLPVLTSIALLLPSHAHELQFPIKKLNLLQDGKETLTFTQGKVAPGKNFTACGEKNKVTDVKLKHLSDKLFYGRDSQKKIKVVAAILESKDTEFGATVNTKGLIGSAKVFSTSQPKSALEGSFLRSLEGKNLAELVKIRDSETDAARKFIIGLSVHALCRVTTSFARK